MMIWFDVAEGVFSEGTDSSTDPIHRQRGYVSASDGRRVDWRLETADGKIATLGINNEPYSLSNGHLFIVTTRGEKTQVQQLDRDLSSIQPTNEGCQAFAKSDPTVSRFIRQAALAMPAPQPILVPPTLLQLEPAQVAPREQVRVIGQVTQNSQH
jgi:hypothetical protein